ncbi:MAG: histidine ammonia-lyase [Zetaproteobacteria bacterium]|nr:histidine ammonia-lyase [Zetaproteobacteria bacterium]
MYTLDLDNMPLTTLKEITHSTEPIQLEEKYFSKVEASFQTVRKTLTGETAIYGINTGFGALADVLVPTQDLLKLQKNLILSHASGVGDFFPLQTGKLTLLLKIISLGRGYSGVSPALLHKLIQMYNHNIYPCMPEKGSVGASGDLAPLAHFACALIGQGQVYYNGNLIHAKQALQTSGLDEHTLGPKEGLSLINGLQVSTATLLEALWQAQILWLHAILIGAISSEAFRANYSPLDARIHQLKGSNAQARTAEILRDLLHSSKLCTRENTKLRIQDPYSFRCLSQTMGSCLDILLYVTSRLKTEFNAVTDNPLVFADKDEIISGGNFHGENIAFLSDYLALALAEIGSLAERRIGALIDKKMSLLPPFLVDKSGLRSGFMAAHVTATALVSENKSLAHPCSVDSIPSSAGQEDHVSMATYASRRLRTMGTNVVQILAIELLCAANGIHWLQSQEGVPNPKLAPKTAKVLTELHKVVTIYHEDRFLHDDIAAAAQFIHTEKLIAIAELHQLSLFEG